jgi:hypothetical protein
MPQNQRRRERLLLPRPNDPNDVTLVNLPELYRRTRSFLDNRRTSKAQKLEKEVERLQADLRAIEAIKRLKKEKEELQMKINEAGYG